MSEVEKRDSIFAKKRNIIAIYLLAVSVKILHAIITSRSSEEIIGYLFALIVYGVLVALVYKGSKIANWIMIVLILLSGAGSLFIGIALVTFDQFVVKSFITIFGLLCIYGGLKLIAIERTGHDSA